MLSPIGARGSRDENGSWKMICAWARNGVRAGPSRAVISSPPNRMRPDVGSSNRTTTRPRVDLPQPDSPTSPRVSPSSIARLTRSTAWTSAVVRCMIPLFTGKDLTRSSISTRALTTGLPRGASSAPYGPALFREAPGAGCRRWLTRWSPAPGNARRNGSPWAG